MNDILNETIRLSVLFEGTLRVALDRPSPEALAGARELYQRIGINLAKLEPDAAPSQSEATAVKDDEAEGAEETPLQEPSPSEMGTGQVVYDDAQASEVARKESVPAAAAPRQAAPARLTADDLRRNLTLNDKFRFRRELFNGSDIEMNDTLQLIASMGSEEEAREYLIDDLQFDPESPTVKDFLDVIVAPFNRK